MTKIFFIVMFLLTENFKTADFLDIAKLKDSLFKKTNKIFQNSINKLFTSLKLNNSFTKSFKIQSLLTMHDGLKGMAESYCEIFKEIENVTKIYEYNKTNQLFELSGLLEDVLGEQFAMNYYENMTNDNKTVENMNATFNENIMLTESTEFVDKFIMRIDNKLHRKYSINRRNNNEINITKPENNELKIWKPKPLFDMPVNKTWETRRIFSGKRAKIKRYPFVASIHVEEEFVCGGSIISKDLVITAASCVQSFNNKLYRDNPGTVSVRVGSDYTDRYGALVQVKQIHFHPLFESRTLKNNLAILRLSKSLHWGKKKVKRIKYDRSEEVLPNDVDSVTLLGWGATNKQGTDTEKPLSLIHLDLYNIEECKDVYSRYYVSDTNFCGGFFSKGGGACNKDAGDPGVIAGVLVGVVSFGPPACGTKDAPTVFTKLGYHALWIDSIVHQKTSLQRNDDSMEPSFAPVTDRITIPNNYNQADLKQPNNRGKSPDYPEEISILTQILRELILRNGTVHDILYGEFDDNFNEIYGTTPEIEPEKHPLVNKSLFFVPELHRFTEFESEKEETVRLTTAYHTTEFLKPTDTPPIDDKPHHEHFNLDDDYANIIYDLVFGKKTTPVASVRIKQNKELSDLSSDTSVSTSEMSSDTEDLDEQEDISNREILSHKMNYNPNQVNKININREEYGSTKGYKIQDDGEIMIVLDTSDRNKKRSRDKALRKGKIEWPTKRYEHTTPLPVRNYKKKSNIFIDLPTSYVTIEKRPFTYLNRDRRPSSNMPIDRTRNTYREIKKDSYIEERTPSYVPERERPNSYTNEKRRPNRYTTEKKTPASYGEETSPNSYYSDETRQNNYVTERTPSYTTEGRRPSSYKARDRTPSSYVSKEVTPDDYISKERRPDSYNSEKRRPNSYTSKERRPNSYTTKDRNSNRYTFEERKPSSYTPKAKRPNRYTSKEGNPNSYTPKERRPNRYTSEERLPNSYTPKERRPSGYTPKERNPNSYKSEERRPNSYTTKYRRPDDYLEEERKSSNYHVKEREETTEPSRNADVGRTMFISDHEYEDYNRDYNEEERRPSNKVKPQSNPELRKDRRMWRNE